MLQVRLKGDEDEISEFIQALKKKHVGCVKNVKKEGEYTLISLVKRMYSKQLFKVFEELKLTRTKIMKSKRGVGVS